MVVLVVPQRLMPTPDVGTAIYSTSSSTAAATAVSPPPPPPHMYENNKVKKNSTPTGIYRVRNLTCRKI